MADAVHYRAADFNSLRWVAADVTPNDGADLPKLAAVIVAATDGNIRVTASGGGTVTLYAIAGIPLPVVVDRVFSTSTNATGIVALYQS
jgi:hypothetical protein